MEGLGVWGENLGGRVRVRALSLFGELCREERSGYGAGPRSALRREPLGGRAPQIRATTSEWCRVCRPATPSLVAGRAVRPPVARGRHASGIGEYSVPKEEVRNGLRRFERSHGGGGVFAWHGLVRLHDVRLLVIEGCTCCAAIISCCIIS